MKVDNFCVAPFTSVQVRPNSTVSVCCRNLEVAKNSKGEPLHLYSDTLDSAVSSPLFSSLRESMLAGERHPACAQCWKADDANGVDSFRKILNRRFSNWIPKIKNGVLPSTPVDLELSLGNLCNLKCRICGPVASSRWAQEYIELFGQDYISRDNETVKNMTTSEISALHANWPNQNESLTGTLRKWIPNVEQWNFVGGEPLLNKKQFELIKMSVDGGYSKGQILQYYTNGTVFPEEAAEKLWPHFRAVRISVSADGLERQFDYQRFGAKWESVLKNIERFRSLQCVETVVISVSVSIFNIYYLPEILKFWSDRGIKVGYSSVFDPDRFFVAALPASLKKRVKDKFLHMRSGLDKASQIFLDSFANQMESRDDSHLWPQTIESIWFHDRHRGEKFQETFKEFYEEMVSVGVWQDYEMRNQ